MESIDEKATTSKFPLSMIDITKQANVISHSSYFQANPGAVQVDSATIYLLKKAASSMWGMVHDFGWNRYTTGIAGGIDFLALIKVDAMFSSKISPYFHSAFETVLPVNGFEFTCTNDSCTQDDDAPPIASDISDSSSCERNLGMTQGGLVFQSEDLNTDESDQQRDYIITQVDISRMARAASSHLDVKSIHQLPTITHRAKKTLICSSPDEVHEEENVGEFLLRNANIIEDYFDNTEDNIELKCRKEDLNSGFSWMMVPNDPSEEDMTRMSNSICTGDIPDSISICKSNDSVSVECNNDDFFYYCVVCQEPFQDGDSLHVLPCQHLLHCVCIDKWLSRKNSNAECVVSGCSMCEKAQLEN